MSRGEPLGVDNLIMLLTLYVETLTSRVGITKTIILRNLVIQMILTTMMLGHATFLVRSKIKVSESKNVLQPIILRLNVRLSTPLMYFCGV